MKNILIIFISLLFFSVVSCNRDSGKLSSDVVSNPNSASGKTMGGLPKVEFEKDFHDFGKLIQGEKATVNFKFKNTGDEDLLITQVKSSCGCTVTEFPKDPISPGNEGIIKVSFDSAGRKGVQSKSINVVHNGQPNNTVIRIKAMVIEP
ncbi:MAG: DUF1573 domain-containing protein [Bacteroidales bacterium]